MQSIYHLNMQGYPHRVRATGEDPQYPGLQVKSKANIKVSDVEGWSCFSGLWFVHKVKLGIF